MLNKELRGGRLVINGSAESKPVTAQRKDLGPLPSYENPPVIEVAIGVVFAKKIDQLRAPHLGVFWDRIKADFPRVDHAIPIGAFDPLGDNIPPLPRVWFIHKDDNFVIQVQSDRLLFNWRQQTSEQRYPRFEAVLNGFASALEKFESFVREISPDPLMPQELSLEYVNSVLRGEGWKDRADLGEVLQDVVWCHTERFLPDPIDLSWRTVFDIGEGNGQLAISSRFGKRNADERELLRIELRAVRKCPDGMQRSEMFDWYSIAHEWIVRGFADVTTEKVQSETWKRT